MSEKKSLSSSKEIVAFLAKQGAELLLHGEVGEWVSSKVLGSLGIDLDDDEKDRTPEQLAKIEEELGRIRPMLHQIKDRLDESDAKLEMAVRALLVEHDATKTFEPVSRIKVRWNDFVGLTLAVETNVEVQKRKLNRFVDSILENGGVVDALYMIHEVLMGRSDTLVSVQREPLLGKVMKNLKTESSLKCRDDKYELVDLARDVEDYLHSIFLLQFMGITMICNARIRLKEFKRLRLDLETHARRLEEQREYMKSLIPGWVLSGAKYGKSGGSSDDYVKLHSESPPGRATLQYKSGSVEIFNRARVRLGTAVERDFGDRWGISEVTGDVFLLREKTGSDRYLGFGENALQMTGDQTRSIVFRFVLDDGPVEAARQWNKRTYRAPYSDESHYIPIYPYGYLMVMNDFEYDPWSGDDYVESESLRNLIKAGNWYVRVDNALTGHGFKPAKIDLVKRHDASLFWLGGKENEEDLSPKDRESLNVWQRLKHTDFDALIKSAREREAREKREKKDVSNAPTIDPRRIDEGIRKGLGEWVATQKEWTSRAPAYTPDAPDWDENEYRKAWAKWWAQKPQNQ